MALGTTANEADQSAFQSDSSGILPKGCGTSLDHGVLASNYDPDAGYYPATGFCNLIGEGYFNSYQCGHDSAACGNNSEHDGICESDTASVCAVCSREVVGCHGQNQPRASLGKSYSAATFGRVYDGDEVAINAYSINFTVGEETYKPGMNQVIIPTWW